MGDSSKQPVNVKNTDGFTRIEVPLLEQYASLAMSIAEPLLLSEFGLEACYIEPPYDPRFDYPNPLLATFEITGELLKSRFRFARMGTPHYFMWPRENIVEIRPNRYERGLWIHVKGQVMETFLSELPPETIAELATELNVALAREEGTSR